MNVATPPNELYERLALLGWELGKVEFKNGVYVAKATSESTGQQIERSGKSPENALAAVYQYAARASQVRRFAALKKLGAWSHNWLDQTHEIGHAYAKLPAFEDKAVEAWKALAAESKIQADAIRRQINVEVTDDPDPYPDAQAMCEDVHNNKHFLVSRANAEHPIWSVDDTVNFRIVHDVIAHCQSGGDFSWEGENLACAVHLPLVSPLAREALFTECIGRQAYHNTHKGLGPQKVALMNEFLHPVQAREGQHAWVPHGGLPDLAYAPDQGLTAPPPTQFQPSPIALMPGGVMHGYHSAAAFPIPQLAYDTAVYDHKCPMCRGYLRDRGGVFTCTSCPFEYDAKNKGQVGMHTENGDDQWSRIGASDWHSIVAAATDGPCTHCHEKVSSLSPMDHTAMPVVRPKYVDPYLETLTGPDEQHALDPGASCVNPKCGYHFTPKDEDSIRKHNGEFVCPNCGTEYDYFSSAKNPIYESDNPEAWFSVGDIGRKANPGGMTRSGLTLSQMGDIGEAVVLRMHELPGIGMIIPASNAPTFPIDAIVEGHRGRFGVEIKTNHSQAQERFKLGGKIERTAKIKYCLAHGLKPALIGVRLNFYTDRAYIFFREGLTDTWIGNQQMAHVATVDFSDLNPFKSPDEHAQALAVEQAHLPDQSNPDADLDAIFGRPRTADVDQPRDEKGRFTFKADVHRLKVVDRKGKHTHDITRCRHCGHSFQRPVGSHGHIECPTCGHDPDRPAHLAKVVLATQQIDDVANELGFTFAGRTGQGHRRYTYTDPNGTLHSVVVGSGNHGTDAQLIDAQRGRQRMTRCLSDQCYHTPSQIVPPVDEPGAPVFHAGQTANVNDREHFIQEIDGGLALVFDVQTGAEDVVPVSELQATSAWSA